MDAIPVLRICTQQDYMFFIVLNRRNVPDFIMNDAPITTRNELIFDGRNCSDRWSRYQFGSLIFGPALREHNK
jgi:hypothetical protein